MKHAGCVLAAALAVAGCATEPQASLPSAEGVKRWTEAGASRPHLSVKARPRRRHLPSPASRDLSRPAIAHNWTDVADCESSGVWHANTGNGYFGGVQMDMAFWRNYGGLRFASRPDLASEPEQIAVAERGLDAQGVGAWPVCGRYLLDAA